MDEATWALWSRYLELVSWIETYTDHDDGGGVLSAARRAGEAGDELLEHLAAATPGWLDTVDVRALVDDLYARSSTELWSQQMGFDNRNGVRTPVWTWAKTWAGVSMLLGRLARPDSSWS